MNRHERCPELEYNLAGGLMLTINPRGLKELCERIRRAGFSKACIFPFRALAKEGGIGVLKDSGLTVVHIEKPWNPTDKEGLLRALLVGFLGHYKRLRGDKSQPPIIQDALFPDRKTADDLFFLLMTKFPQAKFIAYQPEVELASDRLLLAVWEGLEMSLLEIANFVNEKNIAVVFDPGNLLVGEGSWEKQMGILDSQTSGGIEVVDVPWSKGDIEDLLQNKGFLPELVRAAKNLKNLRYLRLEVPVSPLQLSALPSSVSAGLTQFPGSPFKRAGFEFLRDIASALQEQIEK